MTSSRYCDHLSMCPRCPPDLPCPLRSKAQTAKPAVVRPSTTAEYLPECSLIPCTSATSARGCICGDQHRPKREMPAVPANVNSVRGGDCMSLRRTAEPPVTSSVFDHSFLAMTHT